MNQPKSDVALRYNQRIHGYFDHWFEAKPWGPSIQVGGTGTCGHSYAPGLNYGLRRTSGRKGAEPETVCPVCWQAWKKKGRGRCPVVTNLDANYPPPVYKAGDKLWSIKDRELYTFVDYLPDEDMCVARVTNERMGRIAVTSLDDFRLKR